jgi:hypothetical protein
MLLLALSPIQIHFSSTLKQFSLDVLVTLVLCLIGADILRRGATRKSMFWLALAGVVVTWISHPSVFVIGAVLLAAGWSLADHTDRRGFLALSAVAAVLFGMVLIQYFTVLYHSDANRGLEAYWGGAFLPIFSSSTMPWLLSVSASIFPDVLQLPWSVITASMAAVGVLALAVRRWHVLVMLGTPIALALLASSLKLYPFTGRFLLFAAPLLFMIIAQGVATLWTVVNQWNHRAAMLAVMACVVYLAYPLGAKNLAELQEPNLRDHIKPVMAYMQTHRQQGDVVYLYYMAQSQWAYYAPFYDLDDLETVIGIDSRDRPHRYHQDIEALEGRPRVWFVFSHNYTAGRVDEQAFFLTRLDKIGVRMDEAAAPWAAAYLYDLSAAP